MKKSLVLFFGSILCLHTSIYSQNVGVGEATPASKFEIKGDSGTDLFNVKDQTGTSRLYIQNDGDVGIGTVAPNAQLHTTGTVRFQNYTNGILGVNASGNLVSRTLATSGNGVDISNANGVSGNPTISLDYGGSTTGGAYPQGNFGQFENHGTYNDFNTTPSYWGWNYMQGNVNGPNTVSSQWYRGIFSLGGNYSARGTGGYSMELAYPRYDHSEAGVWMRTVENGTIGGWTRIDGSADNENFIHNQTAVNQTASFRINGNGLFDGGNVGIGNASPGYRLDVTGNARFTGQVIIPTTPTANAHAASKQYVDAQVGGVTETDPTWSGLANTTASVGRTGNVGVGIASPAHKLHVAGGNLVIEDGNYITTTGDDIRFLGGTTSDDSSYEWAGFYSGTTRQGIILYDGAWTGANNITNEFSITAEGSNKLTLNTAGGDIALMPDGTGNVGVGTLSPGATLHINGTTLSESDVSLSAGDGKGFRFWNSDNYKIHMGNVSSKYWYGPVQDYSIKMNMNDDNNRGWTWGVLDQSPVMAVSATEGHMALKGSLFLDCASCGSTTDSYPNGGFSWGDMVIQGRVMSSSNNLHLSPPGGDNVIINDSYRAAGGVSSTSNAGLIVYGDAAINTTSLNGSYQFYVNGRIGSNGINETSDRRFKKDIQPLENSLSKLIQLQGVSYHWRQDEFPDREFKEGKDMGVIAQEVEKIFPEVVATDDEGYKSVQYSSLVPVLIEAIKEQNQEIEKLKADHKQELTCLNQKIENYEELFEGIDLEAFKQAFAKENYSAKK